MTIEQIRKAYDAKPFGPFVLHLADGREIPVRSREFMGGVPAGRTVTFHRPDGRRNVVDVPLVTDLEFDSKHSERSPPWIASRFTMRHPSMLERIRRAYRAEPFVPFVLHLADGREIPVRERFFMMLPPGSRLITVAVTDDAFDHIDARLVTDLEFRRGAGKRRRTA